MTAPVEHVREWVKQLAARIAPSMPKAEFVGRVNLLADDLSKERYRSDAYGDASMRYVARNCGRFFPSFGEVCEHLDAHLKPAFPPLYEPDRLMLPSPPPEQRGAQNDEQRRQASEMVRGVVAQLREIGEAKQDAMRTRLPPRKAAPELTRAQLVEAYKRAGVQGPVVVEPVENVVPLRPAAADMPAEVKRGPVIEDGP